MLKSSHYDIHKAANIFNILVWFVCIWIFHPTPDIQAEVGLVISMLWYSFMSLLMFSRISEF